MADLTGLTPSIGGQHLFHAIDGLTPLFHPIDPLPIYTSRTRQPDLTGLTPMIGGQHLFHSIDGLTPSVSPDRSHVNFFFTDQIACTFPKYDGRLHLESNYDKGSSGDDEI